MFASFMKAIQARSRTAPVREVQRARALLLTADGGGQLSDRRRGAGQSGDGGGLAGQIPFPGFGQVRARCGRGVVRSRRSRRTRSTRSLS